jgi:alpha-beta hydrolase superfamily lysophospholipase
VGSGTLALFFVFILALNAVLIWIGWRILFPAFMRKHFVPPRRKPTPLPVEIRGRARDVEIPVDGVHLRGWWVRPEGEARAAAVLTHGWGQEGNRLGAIAAGLVRRGVACLLLDLRGHGRSDPWPDYNIVKGMGDLRAAREWLGRQDGSGDVPAVVLGFSFGGLAATLSVSRDRLWDGGVVIGAPSAPLRAIAYFLEGKKLPGKLLARLMVDRLRETIGIDPRELSTARNLPGVQVPVLVVHGTDDPVVPFEEGGRIAAFVPPEYRSTFWVEGGRHGDVLVRDDVVEAVSAFVVERVAKEKETVH